MWEKETRYKLSLKKNLIYEFCKEAYKESSNFDVILITKNKVRIPAHRIILAISSDLIKSLESDECNQIFLPDFSKSVVEKFLQFLYSGEAMMDVDERNEFISLCNEMMVNIPILGINPDEIIEEDNAVEMQELENEDPENEDPENSVETIVESPGVMDLELLEEIECKQEYNFNEDNDNPQPPDTPTNTENSQERLQNSIETPKIRMKTVMSEYKETDCYTYSMDHKKKIQEAIKFMRRNKVRTIEVARRFGIPKSTLYRRVLREL